MSARAWPKPSPAQLLLRRNYAVTGKRLISELFFEVPPDWYGDSNAGSLRLFGRSATVLSRPMTPLSASEQLEDTKRPWLVFLEGGPGFPCPRPQDYPLT